MTLWMNFNDFHTILDKFIFVRFFIFGHCFEKSKRQRRSIWMAKYLKRLRKYLQGPKYRHTKFRLRTFREERHHSDAEIEFYIKFNT